MQRSIEVTVSHLGVNWLIRGTFSKGDSQSIGAYEIDRPDGPELEVESISIYEEFGDSIPVDELFANEIYVLHRRITGGTCEATYVSLYDEIVDLAIERLLEKGD